jgi:hypothetical protein
MSLASDKLRLRHFLRSQRGQALVEQGLLLATLLGMGAAGGAWLMTTHPQLLNALDIHVRGIYFVLSLP